jgi:hypothetical protein
MTDEMDADQRIRWAALQCAVSLEHNLPHILKQTDDLSPGNDVTEQDAAMMAARVRHIEVETTDRVLRTARLFTDYITTGLDADAERRAWPFPVFGEDEAPRD